MGERRSQQILILLNDTLAHGLDVLLMSLVCGYGVEPDRLHSQTEGSSVRSLFSPSSIPLPHLQKGASYPSLSLSKQALAYLKGSFSVF